MPRAIAKPCKFRGCRNIVRGAQYCKTHDEYNTANQYSGWDRANQGKTAAQRGYGAAWQKTRKQILKRDGYLCQPCKQRGLIVPAEMVDHRINKKAGGTDAPSNLESICRPCHAIKTQAEAKRAQHGTPLEAI